MMASTRAMGLNTVKVINETEYRILQKTDRLSYQ